MLLLSPEPLERIKFYGFLTTVRRLDHAKCLIPRGLTIVSSSASEIVTPPAVN